MIPTADVLPNLLARRAADTPARLVEPEDLGTATISYTSGTTGASKGVLDTWAQIHQTASACPPIDDLGPDDVRYSPFPLFHMSGKLAVCGAAMTGGTLVLRET